MGTAATVILCIVCVLSNRASAQFRCSDTLGNNDAWTMSFGAGHFGSGKTAGEICETQKAHWNNCANNCATTDRLVSVEAKTTANTDAIVGLRTDVAGINALFGESAISEKVHNVERLYLYIYPIHLFCTLTCTVLTTHSRTLYLKVTDLDRRVEILEQIET